MAFKVKEIFLSLQGEGYHSGRRAVFLRFTGCNLWSGREQDRATAACRFCDTDFVGVDGTNGGRYDAVKLASKCAEIWGADHDHRFVVLTGGEPTLQADPWLVDVLHRWEFEVAIETNGTRPVPNNLDWITVSPKPGLPLFQTKGHELKFVYPQDGFDPASFAGLDFQHFYLQPKWVEDAAERAANVQAATRYCMEHPRWRFSHQLHKTLGLP